MRHPGYCRASSRWCSRVEHSNVGRDGRNRTCRCELRARRRPPSAHSHLEVFFRALLGKTGANVPPRKATFDSVVAARDEPLEVVKEPH
jgi:hypothetical protein